MEALFGNRVAVCAGHPKRGARMTIPRISINDIQNLTHTPNGVSTAIMLEFTPGKKKDELFRPFPLDISRSLRQKWLNRTSELLQSKVPDEERMWVLTQISIEQGKLYYRQQKHRAATEELKSVLQLADDDWQLFVAHAYTAMAFASLNANKLSKYHQGKATNQFWRYSGQRTASRCGHFWRLTPRSSASYRRPAGQSEGVQVSNVGSQGR